MSYQFYITPEGGSQIRVYPAYDSLNFTYRKEDGQVFYRFSCDAELTFFDTKSQQDFTTLYAFESSGDRCAQIELLIKKRCEGQWVDYFTGYLNLSDGNWDLDGKKVTIPISNNDEYTCWFVDLKKEVNLFQIPTSNRIAAKLYVGTFEFSAPQTGTVSPPFSYNEGTLDISKGWTVYEHLSTGTGNTATTTWVRENAGGVLPEGDGWEFDTIDLIYARKPATYKTLDVQESNLVQEQYAIAGVDDSNDPLIYDNGLSFEDVIELLNPCDLTIVSNFFWINPDATNPDNAAYTAAAGQVDNLHIWQKSDIKRPATSENATKANLTFEQLLQFLANTFQVYAYIDGTNLRIEHISYFEAKTQGLDLTQAAYSKYLLGTNNYSYDSTNQPIREKFTWMDEVSDDFTGFPIEYDNSCTQREGVTEKEYTNPLFTTDFEFVAAEVNAEAVSDAGFLIAQVVEFSGEKFIPKITIPSSEARFNGALSFIYLHDKFWRNYRPFAEGLLNENLVTFDSVRPVKIQGTITALLCCSDLAGFDPIELIKSGIDWGELMQMRIDGLTNICEIDLTQE
jgi:hypothetical protein